MKYFLLLFFLLTSLSFGQTLTGQRLQLGSTGVLFTQSNGTVTIAGTGNGTDENVIFNLNTANTLVLSSGTGVDTINASGLAFTTTGVITGVGTGLTGTAAGLTAGTASAVAVGGITGLGTGVATGLALNVGSAGAPVLFNGAGGTPSSLTGTNITGTAAGLTAGSATTIPNLTGHITSTGNATVLGTFTLAQLNAAVSDADAARTDAGNTFTGVSTASAWVLTSPTITTKLSPTTDDGAPLGDTTHHFSDLFLAEGAVINWDNGDATLTQVGNVLTLAGADLTVPVLNATTLAGAGGGVTLDASGFNGNLAGTDNTVQEVAQKLDDLVAAGGGTAGAPLFVQTASAAAVTDGSETTILSTGAGSKTIPVNWFTSAGNVLDVRFSGKYSTGAIPGTLQLKLKFGATVVAQTAAFTPIISVTDGVYSGFVRLVARTVGASGTIFVADGLLMEGATLTPGLPKFSNPTLGTAVTIDTTATQVVDVTAQWGTAATNSITGYTFEMVGPGSAVSSVFGMTGAVANLSGDVVTSGSSVATIQVNSVALTTDTSGNYAAGDGEAGASLSGDSATAYFSTGTLEVARGGTGIGAFGTGVATALGVNTNVAGGFSPIDGTATLTGKTIDGAASGNVIKLKGYLYLMHADLVDGAGATFGTTPTSITYGHATFSNSADKAVNYVEYFVPVPEDIDTAVALRARLKVLIGADTADQNWLVSSVSVADSAVPGSATLANEIALDYTADASGANGDVETTAWTTLTSWNSALTAGQTWRIRLMRDGDTSDASTVNSTEQGLIIEYGITQ